MHITVTCSISAPEYSGQPNRQNNCTRNHTNHRYANMYFNFNLIYLGSVVYFIIWQYFAYHLVRFMSKNAYLGLAKDQVLSV